MLISYSIARLYAPTRTIATMEPLMSPAHGQKFSEIVYIVMNCAQKRILLSEPYLFEFIRASN